MKQFIGLSLTLILVLSTLGGGVSWLSPINAAEPTFSWTVRIATAILFPVSLVGLIVMAAQPESVPDFLEALGKRRMGRGGVLFVFDCVARDRLAWLEIHYQNRFDKPAYVAVAVQPSQNFTMARNEIDPVLVQFSCGPAAYGIIRVPIALRREYQGHQQLFDVAAQDEYPQGTGNCLRNTVGPEISKLNVLGLKTAVALARFAATGHLVGLTIQSRVKLLLPLDVAEAADQLPAIQQDEQWVLPENENAPGLDA